MSAKKLLMAHCYSLHGHEKVHVFWYILNDKSKLSRPHKIDRTYLTTTLRGRGPIEWVDCVETATTSLHYESSPGIEREEILH